MDGLTVGRIVHYTDNDTGRHLAAIIVEVDDAEAGIVSLRVFQVSSNGSVLKDYVHHDHPDTRMTWHWPEYVP